MARLGDLHRQAQVEAAVAALRHHSAAVMAALAFTVLLLDDGLPDNHRWFSGLAAAFTWSVAVSVAVRWRWPRAQWIAALAPWFAGMACLPLILLPDSSYTALTLPVVGGFAVTAVPLCLRGDVGDEVAARWVGQLMWFVALAMLASLILCGGVAATLLAVMALFDFGFPRELFRSVWIVGVATLVPLCVLAQLPRDPETAAAFGFPDWGAVLLRWALAPLALVFAVILNVYCANIAVRGALPQGVVASVVVAYVGLGGAVWAASVAVRSDSGTSNLLRLAFLPALLAPAVVLFVAAWLRIAQHGVTGPRYVLVVIAVLLPLLVALQGLRRRVPSPATVGFIAGLVLLGTLLIGPRL